MRVRGCKLYVSVKQISKEWGVTERRVRTLCKEGRVPGAMLVGSVWQIPSSAEKPADARSKARETTNSQDRVYLFLSVMPDDEAACAAMPQDERLAREANDLYLKGDLEQAAKAVRALARDRRDDGYQFITHAGLCGIYAASGAIGKSLVEVSKARIILAKNPSLTLSRRMLSLYMGGDPGQADFLDVPEHSIPVFAWITLYRSVMSALAGEREIDVVQSELVCRMLDCRDAPACALYAHIVMAMYYGCTAFNKERYRKHIDKAIAIALPRRWCMPLAEFSYSLGWEELRELDPAAFEHVRELGEALIDGYIKSGRFSPRLPRLREVTPTQVHAAFMMASGKTNAEIADSLGVSMYRVKQLVQEVYNLSGTNNRRELREFVTPHFKKL